MSSRGKMPRKIVPVPGVLPHEWHKHQPPCSEEESNKQSTPSSENIPKIKTESVSPQEPNGNSTEPKSAKVALKQWQTTANDPARLHRQMRAAYQEPPRAVKLGENVEYGGRLLYPHEAAALQREPSPESERPVRQHMVSSESRQSRGHSWGAKPQPLYPHHQSGDQWLEYTKAEPQDARRTPSTSVWRDFAANPESSTVHQQSSKDTEPAPAQRQSVTNSGPPKDSCPAEKTHEGAQSNGDPEPVTPAPMRSPDLRDMQIPRPNCNYVASVRSMVSVLSLDEDHNARGEDNVRGDDNARGDGCPEQSPMKHSDIRSKIGLEHNLHMSSGGKLINTDIWAEKARKPEEIFLNPVYANPWIEDYVENQIDYDVRADFLYKEDPVVHCHCDVDTFSGKLLNPIQHEYTVPDYMNSESLDRQMTRTASLYVKRKAIKANARKNHGGGPPRPPPGWVDTPTPLSTATPEPPVQKPAQPTERARAKSDPDPFSPRVSCHLRPAQVEHMDGVRFIYNWELLNGLQALDTEPLSLADWEGILNKTRDAQLPFVVVISGPYQLQAKMLQRDAGETPADVGKVLAFGFLAVRDPGLAGSLNGSSRMSVKAHVFVHPGYRRKKLGHVCLDKLLATVSIRYSTKLGYEFVNPDDNPTYKYPWQHDRKVFSVFVEYFVPRTRDVAGQRFVADESGLERFERIMTRYGFWKTARLEAAHRSRRTYEPAPVWLDTVMFEHRCQEGLGFTQIL